MRGITRFYLRAFMMSLMHVRAALPLFPPPTQYAATCTLPTVWDRDVTYPSYFKMEGRGFFSLLEDKQYEIALPETNPLKPIWPSNSTFIGTKRISTVMSRPNADRDYGVDSMDLKFHTTLRNDQASSMKSGENSRIFVA